MEDGYFNFTKLQMIMNTDKEQEEKQENKEVQI